MSFLSGVLLGAVISILRFQWKVSIGRVDLDYPIAGYSVAAVKRLIEALGRGHRLRRASRGRSSAALGLMRWP
jgi:hypothetical protein